MATLVSGPKPNQMDQPDPVMDLVDLKVLAFWRTYQVATLLRHKPWNVVIRVWVRILEKRHVSIVRIVS